MSKKTTDETGIKYPTVTVELIGHDGNAFAILCSVQKALRRADVDAADVKAYMDDAMSGNYDNLLRVTMGTVNVI